MRSSAGAAFPACSSHDCWAAGDSAIFALLRAGDPVHVVDRLAGYGGTILRTTLTDKQTAKLQKVLDNRGR